MMILWGLLTLGLTFVGVPVVLWLLLNWFVSGACGGFTLFLILVIAGDWIAFGLVSSLQSKQRKQSQINANNKQRKIEIPTYALITITTTDLRNSGTLRFNNMTQRKVDFLRQYALLNSLQRKQLGI